MGRCTSACMEPASPPGKEGNLYTAQVQTGRVQKYTPRRGANPHLLVGKPWPAFGRSGALFSNGGPQRHAGSVRKRHGVDEQP